MNFLEMAHTNFVSSIRMTAYQPLIQTKITKNTCFLNFEMFENKKSIKNTFSNIFIYIQPITHNLIQTLKMTIYNTKHTQNTQIHFQQSFFSFPKTHKWGFPGPVRAAFDLKNWFAYVKKDVRCHYTNATWP